jgi:hypothetical protein
MDTIRNVTQLLIGADVAESTIASGVLITSGSQFNDGEIFITDVTNHYMDATDVAPDGLYKYGQARGSEILWSDVIDLKNNLNGYAIGTAADKVNQWDFVGYNGVSGALDTLASNIYTIRLNILDKNTAGFMQQKIKEGFYKSSAVAASYTQQRVALGLVASLIKNYSRETEQDLRFERINGGAQADALATAEVTMVKGSKYLVPDEDLTALVTAGTILRFGTTGAGTAPCYVVVGHDGGAAAARVYELDVAWQGDTGLIAAASFESVTEGDWGVSIQGIWREFKAGYYFANVIFWDTQIDFGPAQTTVVTRNTAAYQGVGSGHYVKNLELELQSDEFIYRGFPEAGVVDRQDAEASALGIYDVQVIEHEHNLKAAQGTPTESPKTLMIAWRISSNANATAIVAIQEALFTAANATFTAQGGNLT